MPVRRVTIVGGGLGGLVAAIACRERGLDVTLLESSKRLGGRGRSLDEPFRANWGPHVIYADTALWQWLDERRLGEPARRFPPTAPIRYRVRDGARRVPPLAAARAVITLRRQAAPNERSFDDWASMLVGERAARQVASFAAALTFDASPGRLSAAFVMDRVRQLTRMPPTARYVIGGWTTLIERLTLRARDMGAVIECGHRVDSLPEPPVILAVKLETAARLVQDRTLAWPGGRVATVDVGIASRRSDSYLLFDLDESGFAVTLSTPERSAAPSGHRLVQAQMGMRDSESLEGTIRRIEGLLDTGFTNWRERVTWRRDLRLTDQTGALDPPGTTWRDRPCVDRGSDVFVVSDKSGAPGLLGEVSFNAALQAAATLASESITSASV